MKGKRIYHYEGQYFVKNKEEDVDYHREKNMTLVPNKTNNFDDFIIAYRNDSCLILCYKSNISKDMSTCQDGPYDEVIVINSHTLELYVSFHGCDNDNNINNLKSGKILGACLDVLEYESVSFEHLNTAYLSEAFQYLIRSDKVILSPHIAGWTFESNEKMASVLAEKIISNFC